MVLKVINRAPFQSYPDSLAFLDQLDVSVMKLGTERMERVLRVLENPQDQIKTIHVAGTNGKGSVCAMLSSIYTLAGYKTGLFISPHLTDIRERIQRQDQPITPEEFLKAAQAVYPAMIQALPDPRDWLTYFEYLNVMAFWLFANQDVDIAIIETGLGGRLDSTNTIEKPEAIAITSISLDHMDRLGYTLAEIAEEKGGIFKQGSPVFTVRQTPEVMKVFSDMASQVDAPLYRVGAEHLQLGSLYYEGSRAYRIINDQKSQVSYALNLLGRYQHQNLSLVMRLIDYLKASLPVGMEAIRAGLKFINWPGRLQYLPHRNLILDGSHNPAGFESLLETLALDFPDNRIHWGISLLETRPLTSVLPLLGYKQGQSVHFLSGRPAKRFHPAQAFVDIPFNYGQDVTVTYGKSAQEFCMLPTQPGELKVLTGSLYTAGSILSFFEDSTPLQ